jgi:carbonic anhydrase/acetyltransferase-like protein (isoleucine patch superfamily)/ketosteroid isomerase-like protein
MSIYEFGGKRPVISQNAFVHPEAVVIGNVTIGDACLIAPGAVIRGDFGPIGIGDGSSIQDNATIHVTPGDKVIIAKNVIVGHNAVLHDVTIHERCVVGMGAILLQNVVCEEDVVVAAGSVVPTGMHIPAMKLVAGNPAKIIKDISPEMKAYVAMGIEEYKKLTYRYRETMKEVVAQLSRDQIRSILTKWNEAWNAHDLDQVLELFDDDIVFENWTGATIRGKDVLRKSWAPWFTNHGGFRFITEDIFIDEKDQKVLFQWALEWPSGEEGYQGKLEKRRGVDVIHFRDGKIGQKFTYSKTTLEIGNERVKLVAKARLS